MEKRLPVWGPCCSLRGFRACKNTVRLLNGNLQIAVTLIEREEAKWTRGQGFTRWRCERKGSGSPTPFPFLPSLFPGLEILEGSRRHH